VPHIVYSIMAQIVNEVIELGATFDNHRIRKCNTMIVRMLV
jgi:hypothetical protein